MVITDFYSGISSTSAASYLFSSHCFVFSSTTGTSAIRLLTHVIKGLPFNARMHSKSVGDRNQLAERVAVLLSDPKM